MDNYETDCNTLKRGIVLLETLLFSENEIIILLILPMPWLAETAL